MDSKVSPRLGSVILCAAAASFAANHVCARIAFDHGSSVAMAVLIRSAGTALVLFLLMRLQNVPLAIPRPLRGHLAVTGVFVAAQSFCLYSAVAIIPAALALLVFQASPILFLLLSWATGKEKPRLGAILPMLLAFVGIAIALDIRPDKFDQRWSEIGAGVSWAFAGALCFVYVFYSNTHALKPIDSRPRILMMTAITAVVVLIAGASTSNLAVPRDGTGWLGIALLTAFYCIAMTITFTIIPKLGATSSVALNFEPIVLLGLGWVILGQAVSLLQVVGAFVTVGSIIWLGGKKH